MLQKDNILDILKKAACIDKQFELFGSGTHRYKLNPAISNEFVNSIETVYALLADSFEEVYQKWLLV